MDEKFWLRREGGCLRSATTTATLCADDVLVLDTDPGERDLYRLSPAVADRLVARLIRILEPDPNDTHPGEGATSTAAPRSMTIRLGERDASPGPRQMVAVVDILRATIRGEL